MDRDHLLELIGKRLRKVHNRSLPILERVMYKQPDSNFWIAAFYYNPNFVYAQQQFSNDHKLRALTDQYMSNYAGVKARIMHSFMREKT